MTGRELVDYISNNDLDIQVIRNDVRTINKALKYDGFDVDYQALKTAIKQVREREPHIRLMVQQGIV